MFNITMEEIMAESVTVKEGYYDKINNIHCGVIRGFKVTCGGSMTLLCDDGDEFLFERQGIAAKRGGDEVTFTKD